MVKIGIFLAKPWIESNAARGLWRPDNRGERSTSVQNTSIDAFIRMISERGIMGILRVIGAAVFAISWMVLPCFVCAVQRSISHCSQELRALNSKMDLVIARMLFECNESNDLSPYDTTNSTIIDGKAP